MSNEQKTPQKGTQKRSEAIVPDLSGREIRDLRRVLRWWRVLVVLAIASAIASGGALFFALMMYKLYVN